MRGLQQPQRMECRAVQIQVDGDERDGRRFRAQERRDRVLDRPKDQVRALEPRPECVHVHGMATFSIEIGEVPIVVGLRQPDASVEAVDLNRDSIAGFDERGGLFQRPQAIPSGHAELQDRDTLQAQRPGQIRAVHDSPGILGA